MPTATTERVIESFTRHLRAENKSVRTIRAYTYAVDSLLAFAALRGMPRNVEAIAREHIETWLADGLERLSPATVHQWYRSCQQFFKWLVDEDYIDASPMAHMKPPSLPETLPPVLSEDEMVRLIKVVSGRGYEERRDNAIIRLLLDTGMRLAECAGLTLETVDLNTQVAVVMGKGGKERSCPFGNKTSRAIDRYLMQRDQHVRHDENALWLGHEGPMTDSGLYQVIRRRGTEAGIINLHPHRFRHAAANEWLKAGGAESHLMVLMGWSSPTMVRRYAKSAAASRAQAEHRRLALGDRL